MPKIILKPNSPEFEDGTKPIPPGRHKCDMPNCTESGDYRAPKDRGLKDYYWFCLTHVQEYNKAWDFFSGMSPEDIEHHINTRTVWERPTRRYDGLAGGAGFYGPGFHGADFRSAEDLRKRGERFQNFTDEEDEEQTQSRTHSSNHSRAASPQPSPEAEAMRIMELSPPLTLDKLNARYRSLVKKYHPDHNRGNAEGEEILKQVNMAFTILKMAYKKYEDLTSKK